VKGGAGEEEPQCFWEAKPNFDGSKHCPGLEDSWEPAGFGPFRKENRDQYGSRLCEAGGFEV
jgi:hypothetical protein